MTSTATTPQGRIVLDGTGLELVPRQGGGFEWTPHLAATLPGLAQTDEAQVQHTPREHHRTYAWMDFSGGMGAARVQAGIPNTRTHYSEGARGDHAGRLVRGHEVRTLAIANGEGSVTDFFEIGGKLYCIVGPSVREITPTLNAETVAVRRTDGAANGNNTGVYLSTLTFTRASPPWYDGTSTKVYLGTTDNADPAVSFDGTTWTQDGATAFGYTSINAGGDGQRLWASTCATSSVGVGIANIGQGQDPFAATIGTTPWSSIFRLANRSSTGAITGLAALRDTLVVTTADGMVWAVPYVSGVFQPMTDQDGAIASTTAGLGMRYWAPLGLIVPTPRGLLAYVEAADTWEAIGPLSLHGHEMPVRDGCTALYAGDPEWLYAAFTDGTNAHVWSGRRRREGEPGVTRMVWESVAHIASRTVTALRISHLEATANQPILCMGTGNADLRFVTLPRVGLGANGPHGDANCRSRITSHKTYLPDQDGGAPTTSQVFTQLRVTGSGLSYAEYVDVAVRVDRGNYYAVGRVDRPGTYTLSLPTGTEGGSLGVELDWQGTTALATFPEIGAVEVDAAESAGPAKWVDVAVLADREARTTLGQRTHGAATVQGFVEALAKQVRPVECRGPRGERLTVKVDPFAGVHTTTAQLAPQQPPVAVVRFRLSVYAEDEAGTVLVWDSGTWSSGANRTVWNT